MPTEDSPSIDLFENGIPSRLPVSNAGKQRSQRAIVVLLILAVILSGVKLLQSNFIDLNGRGGITGQILDEHGQALAASIFTVSEAQVAETDANGRFTLQNIPAGRQTVIVAVMSVGREYPITVRANTQTDLGIIQLNATARPGHGEIQRLEWR
jgi:hypothetical protein